MRGLTRRCTRRGAVRWPGTEVACRSASFVASRPLHLAPSGATISRGSGRAALPLARLGAARVSARSVRPTLFMAKNEYPSKNRAILISALLSPLAVVPMTALVGLEALVESQMTRGTETVASLASAFVVTSLFAVAAAYIVMLVIGIPAALLALSAGQPRLTIAIGVGVASGLLVWWLFHYRSSVYDLRSAIMFASYGFMVSTTFVLVFRRVAHRVDTAAA